MHGLHLTADLLGCGDPQALMRDRLRLSALCETLVAQAGLRVVGRQFHTFAAASGADAGITGVLLLAESHLALHTWPEFAAVTLDVFVCNFLSDNSHKAESLVDGLVPLFQPQQVKRQRLTRGFGP